MWIEEKNGKYKFIERYKDYLTEKEKRVSVTMSKNTATTRKLAQEQLQAKINEANLSNPTKSITFKQLTDIYLKWQSTSVKQSTYRRNKFAVKSLLTIIDGDVIVSKLTSYYINSAMRASSKSDKSISELMARLKAIVHWGYDNDLIESAAFIDKVKPPKVETARERNECKFLESEEAILLLKSIEDSEKWWRYYVVQIMLLSGLRIGELIALEIDDVDLANRNISVTKTYDVNNGIITSTKTASSNRDVYIQDELYIALKKAKNYYSALKLSRGVSNKYFVVGRDGQMLQYASFNKYLKELSQTKLDKYVTTHTLRHTHASLLMAEGYDIDAISRRLGHIDSKITKEIYLHITSKVKEHDNEAIKKLKII